MRNEKYIQSIEHTPSDDGENLCQMRVTALFAIPHRHGYQSICFAVVHEEQYDSDPTKMLQNAKIQADKRVIEVLENLGFSKHEINNAIKERR